jgi:gas vesicle protein
MSDWIKTLAPLLGTALGGPLGGAAATFIADKLGLESKTIEAVSEVLNSGKLSPDQISQIKLAEVDFKKFMADHEIKLEQISADDRKSARELQASSRSSTPAVLTYIITLGFFGVLGGMFYWPDLKESAPLMIMLGSLGTAWTGACAFWFGTTHNSQTKTDLLAKADAIK